MEHKEQRTQPRKAYPRSLTQEAVPIMNRLWTGHDIWQDFRVQNYEERM